MNEKILAEVRFYFAQCVFNTQCHYSAFGRMNERKKTGHKIVVGFSFVTIILLILQVVGLEWNNDVLIKIVSFVGLLLSGATLLYEQVNKEDFSMAMCQHKIYAEKYKSLRDQYMSLIGEIMDNANNDSILRSKKDNLLKEYSKIGELAPSTNGEDYMKSQQGLGLTGNDEKFTWSDEEINRFLPEKMRI